MAASCVHFVLSLAVYTSSCRPLLATRERKLLLRRPHYCRVEKKLESEDPSAFSRPALSASQPASKEFFNVDGDTQTALVEGLSIDGIVEQPAAQPVQC